MAEKRMFAKTIVTSDAFLDMPTSARCLYFTLGMYADDDGFVNNPRSIMRQIGSSTDDLNLLFGKRFVLAFDSGVVVIKHWCIHNTIQKDRYKETKYVDEKSLLKFDENGAYTFEEGTPLNAEKISAPLTDARQKRLEAKQNSSLPYSFEYKIRQAFYGQPCPVCGRIMDGFVESNKPTIQHNIPISLGGKHEIDNISIICYGCNCSIQNRQETPPYNTDKVKSVWECIGNVSGMDTQVRLGKDSIVKVSKGEVNCCAEQGSPPDSNPSPVKEKYPVIYSDVISYLNEKAGTSYKPSTKSTQEHIRARQTEGFTLDDFKRVIDNKCAEWLKDTKMSKFLRPETLFGNKFESYLNKPVSPYTNNLDFLDGG